MVSGGQGLCFMFNTYIGDTMNYIIKSICFMFALFIFQQTFTYSATTIKYVIGNGGSLKWNGFHGDACDCPFEGNNCYFEETKNPSNLVRVENGWNLYEDLETINYKIEPPSEPLFYHPVSVSEYTFPTPSKIIIEECDEWPELVNREIIISGITTDEDGKYSVFIPEE